MLTTHDQTKIDSLTSEDRSRSGFPQVEDDSGRYPVASDTALSAVGKSLTTAEIDALLSRRDLIVKLFDERVTTLGHGAVLFALN